MMITEHANGFVVGVDEPGAPYPRETKHPALSSSVARVLLQDGPRDAWDAHNGEHRGQTAAMRAGSLLDLMLTGEDVVGAMSRAPRYVHVEQLTTKRTETEYFDALGFRVVTVDAFQSVGARHVKADGELLGLTVVTAFDMSDSIDAVARTAHELTEAGFSAADWQRQVPIYWVERATSGNLVQCRGRLDFARVVDGEPARVVDLKRVRSLNERKLQTGAAQLLLEVQAAAYSRGIRMATDSLRSEFAWLFVREQPRPAAQLRPIGDMLLEIGDRRWMNAVNSWSDCIQVGRWPQPHTSEPLDATPWQLAEFERFLAEEDTE